MTSTPIMSRSELRLFRATGEELLIMAIAGRSAERRRIEQELDLRAMLGEGPRRPRRKSRRTSARIVHRRAA